MMSGIIKRVLAFTICIAMLTGSIPANAEGTVSGSSIPAVTSSTTSDSSDTLDENKDTNLGNDADSDSNQNNNSGSDSDVNKVIDDEKTPTGPAPSTDGTGSVPGGTVSGNKGDQTTVSENKNSETVSENKAEETVSDNSVSDNSVSDNSVSDNTLSGNSIEYLTWSQTVDGVTITVSANKLSVPEGTDLSVDQLDPVEVEVLENTIAEEEEQQSIVIKKYKAFDITLVNDGEPVTPSEEVKVTFTGDILVDEMEDGDELKVYHLDDSDTKIVTNKETGEKTEVATLNDMDGTVASDAVVMDTPHFSTYLIALQGSGISALTNSAFVTVESVDYSATINDSSYNNNKHYVQFRVYVGTALIAKETYPTISKCFMFNEPGQTFKITAGTDFILSNVKYSKSETYLKSNGTELSVNEFIPNTYNKVLDNYKDSGSGPKYINYFDIYLDVKPPTITASKSVSLLNWDDRTYNISLNAQAGGATTYKQNSDIMLVLDKSGSMSFYDVFEYKTSGNNTSSLDATKEYYIVLNIAENRNDPSEYYGYVLKKNGNQWQYKYNGTWINYTGGEFINDYGRYYYYYYNIYQLGTGADDRMTGLKKATKDFINSTGQNSAYSKIGITSFSDVDDTLISGLVEANVTNVNTLNTSVESIKPSGGTLPEKGLNDAYTEISNNATNEKRYVILFSDGEPNGGVNSEAARLASEAAYRLKTNLGVTVYTICYGAKDTEDTNFKWLKNNIATKPASGSSDAYAFIASNASQLSNIFTQISNEINGTGVTITSNIDRNFVILDENNIQITGNDVAAYGGVIKTTGSGTTLQQSIIWSLSSSDIGTTGWTKNIRIKAKDTYMGNNNVSTDAGGSGITINSSPKVGFTCENGSSVNVKARFDSYQTSDTIFLGENLTDYLTETKTNSIFNPKVVKYGVNTLYGYEASNFTQQWIEDLNKNTIIEGGEPIFETATFAQTVFPKVETKYLLKTVFDPDVTESSANINSTLSGIVYSNGEPGSANEVKAIGIYDIYVIRGDIKITKNIISPNFFSSFQGDPIFTFKIINIDNDKTFFRTLRFQNGTTTQLYATINGLPKGNYKVEELKTMGYTASGITVDTHSNSSEYCNNAPVENTVTFSIGAKQMTNNIYKFRQHADVAFNNIKIRTSGKLTHTDVVKNTFVISKDEENRTLAKVSGMAKTVDNN